MRLPLVFILILFFIAFLTDFGIAPYISRILQRKFRRFVIIIELISALIGYGLLIAVLCIPVRSETSAIQVVMWLLYTFLSIYVAKLCYLTVLIIASIISKFRKNRRDRRRFGRKPEYRQAVAIGIGIIAFASMWYGVLFTRNEIVVNRVEIKSPKLPSSFENYKIVQFSDAHVGTWGNDTSFVSRLVNRINSLNPDVIFFTGDIVNRETVEMEPFMSVLRKLKAKDGVYSVLGNHDYGDYIDWHSMADKRINIELMKAWQRQMGWRLLNNERKSITRGRDTIMIIGVENWGEPPFHQYGKLIDAYPVNRDSVYNLNDNRFKILLTHNPEHWSREVTHISNIDLSLSGHTHAMQMMMSIGDWSWSPSSLRYPYWGGLYSKKAKDGTNMKLYVNIGAGEVGIPARFGSAYPEITEIILKK